MREENTIHRWKSLVLRRMAKRMIAKDDKMMWDLVYTGLVYTSVGINLYRKMLYSITQKSSLNRFR